VGRIENAFVTSPSLFIQTYGTELEKYDVSEEEMKELLR
jgi:hypothetical protein